MTPTDCPTCGEGLIHLHMHQGFVHCRFGHVVTVAPIHQIDPDTLVEFTLTAADHAAVAGQRIFEDRVERWRSLTFTEPRSHS